VSSSVKTFTLYIVVVFVFTTRKIYGHNPVFLWQMNILQQPEEGVVVEYEFFELPDMEDLPSRVVSAVEELIRRERTPSDDDVRTMVQSVGDETGHAQRGAHQQGRVQMADQPQNESAGGMPTTATSQREGAGVRVRVVMPHANAVELALHRSFQNGGNPARESRLTPREIQILARQSTLYRLRRLRRCNFPRRGVVTRSRALQARHARARASERLNCVICIDPIRYPSTRIFLSCGHVYHRACIIQALAVLPRRCPSCRAEILLETEFHEAETDVTF